MTNEQQLRETLSAHAEECGDNPARVGQMRRRVRAYRLRQATGASFAAAVVVVAAVVVPVTAAHRGSTSSRVASATSPSGSVPAPAAPSRNSPTPVTPSLHGPEDPRGGRKIGGAVATSPADGSLTYTFTPTSLRLLLTITCTPRGGAFSLTLNGHPITSGDCGGGGRVDTYIGNFDDQAVYQPMWKEVVNLGQPNTVVMTLVTAFEPSKSGPLPRAQRKPGTLASVMYQAVPSLSPTTGS